MASTIDSVRIRFHKASKESDPLKAIQMVAEGLDDFLGILDEKLKYFSDDLISRLEEHING